MLFLSIYSVESNESVFIRFSFDSSKRLQFKINFNYFRYSKKRIHSRNEARLVGERKFGERQIKTIFRIACNVIDSKSWPFFMANGGIQRKINHNQFQLSNGAGQKREEKRKKIVPQTPETKKNDRNSNT